MTTLASPPGPHAVRGPARAKGRLPGRAWLLVERNLMVNRHTWALFTAEILEPLLYLFAMGVGIGGLIGHVPGLDGTHVGYSRFVAPALLATTAMNGALNETTYSVYFKLTDDRVYDSLVTTPLTVWDVALGEIAWAVLRGVVACTGFLAVIGALGFVSSPWALLALPGAVLTAFCFGAIGLAATTFFRSPRDFQLVQLVMLPMFLFATTFYPVTVYPHPIRVLVELLPLYHSIELLREPALGHVGPGLLTSAAFLTVLGLIALVVGARRLERRLKS
ncbi:ABC transporter permease [Streptacidiphilus jiangxiensis]|uniref:Transport permease protein n=1 Tax=Streptacidiphilus jiangxiensis TaxID=235985 RepID=A0A1H7N0Q6_STRJI|nr:ABC transporter permease [Streptacidiphilus jiangxiensis]SEL16911.1 lipooligosaccharide transport system permease protein [Streptacidiphilus jiangxiensis]